MTSRWNLPWGLLGRILLRRKALSFGFFPSLPVLDVIISEPDRSSRAAILVEAMKQRVQASNAVIFGMIEIEERIGEKAVSLHQI